MTKRNQLIIASIIGTLAAIAIGYFGVQIFGQTVMYGISAGMFGLGAGWHIGQALDNRRKRRRVVIKQPKQRVTQTSQR